MADPAHRSRPEEDAPSFDPSAVERRYAAHRARRHARVRRTRDRRYAHVRFFVVILLLLALCIFLAVTSWREIERLFGL